MSYKTTITWKHEDRVDGCYAGKRRVGSVYFDGMRSSEQAPYTITCLLPGIKPKTVGLGTMDDAKNLLERMVRHWFAGTEHVEDSHKFTYTNDERKKGMETFWTQVWQILREECGADEDDMCFIGALGQFSEWRFQGALGFGGKIWHVNDDLYVNCYPEDRNAERDAMLERANFRLANLVAGKGE